MNLEDIVREGKVTAVNESKRIAKVRFDTLGIESDWMPAINMPKTGDLAVVLYFPVFNGDGVILGGIKPWR